MSHLDSKSFEENWNNSICIPIIYKSIRKKDLWEFMDNRLGKISRIDFVYLHP